MPRAATGGRMTGYSIGPDGVPVIHIDLGKVKPNHQSKPGPIGNTQGIIVPQTNPNLGGNSAPVPQAPPGEQKGWWKSWGSAVTHGVLDVVGMIPVVGEPANLIGAGIYALEGDYVSAAMDLAAMIPTGGQAATAAKYGRKVGQEVVEQTAKKADDVAAAAAKRSDDAAANAAKKSDTPPPGKKNGDDPPNNNNGGRVNGPNKRPRCGELGKYQEMKDKYGSPQLDDLDRPMQYDHVPSRAALVRRAEQLKGRRLSSTELARIRDNAQSVAIPETMHRESSRTWFHRNKKPVVEADASDLAKAVRKDTDAITKATRAKDPRCLSAYKQATRQLRQMTNKDFDAWLNRMLDAGSRKKP